MKYRILGKTGMKVSVIGVGAWQFGGEWGQAYTQAEADNVIDAARERGFTLIDTAECYGDHLSERLIGDNLARRGDRANWTICTKFGHKFYQFMDRTIHLSPNEVRLQLEDSLLALRTDYVDLYQFHSFDNDAFQTEGLWEMLREQVQAGKIRHLGISVNQKDGEWQTERAGDVGAEAIQVIYNRLDRRPEERLLPDCQRRNLGVLARVPLASGFLSGKYKPGHRFDNASDVRSRRQQKQVDETLREVERIAREEAPAGVPLAEWALAWCLKHPAVTCVIPGCRNAAQVESNARAAEIDLGAENHPQAAN